MIRILAILAIAGLSVAMLPAVPAQASDMVVASASQSDVKDAQQMLNALGYDAGSPDGIMGSRTRNAIRMFQVDKAMAVTGEVTPALLRALKDEVAARGVAVQSGSSGAAPTTAGSSDARLQKFVDRLRAIVAEGDQKRAADTWFLDKLKSLLADYEWPWRHQVLSLDLTQAGSVRQSGFQVDAGSFAIDRNAGLVGQPAAQSSSSGGTTSKEELAISILGALLKGNQSGGTSGSASQAQVELAQAHYNVTIANAFAISATVSVRDASGPLSIGVFRDRLDGAGYRLVVQPGAELGIVQMLADGSQRVVASVKPAVDVADGRMHTLDWTRGRDGRMSVSVDGTKLLDATDSSVSGAFQGLLLRDGGGDWALREITVSDAG